MMKNSHNMLTSQHWDMWATDSWDAGTTLVRMPSIYSHLGCFCLCSLNVQKHLLTQPPYLFLVIAYLLSWVSSCLCHWKLHSRTNSLVFLVFPGCSLLLCWRLAASTPFLFILINQTGSFHHVIVGEQLYHGGRSGGCDLQNPLFLRSGVLSSWRLWRHFSVTHDWGY